MGVNLSLGGRLVVFFGGRAFGCTVGDNVACLGVLMFVRVLGYFFWAGVWLHSE